MKKALVLFLSCIPLFLLADGNKSDSCINTTCDTLVECSEDSLFDEDIKTVLENDVKKEFRSNLGNKAYIKKEAACWICDAFENVGDLVVNVLKGGLWKDNWG